MKCLRSIAFLFGALPAMLPALLPIPAHGQMREIVLRDFPSFPDGENPEAGIIMDAAGNFYGTTEYGGSGNGVVYRLSAADRVTVLHSFAGGADGANPYAPVAVDASGNLYGTTLNGGTGSHGVVFEVDADGNETVLYSFTGGSDGGNPYAGVVLDSAGNLYGTTYHGGGASAGVVYRVDPSGHETVLYNFTGGADGSNPYAGVVFDSAGNLYGTTYAGGTAGQGTVYKLTPSGEESVLHSFTGKPDGGKPYAGVVLDSAGNLFGTTYSGGMVNGGVIYKIDTTGHETVLCSFEGAPGPDNPKTPLILDDAGNLYGASGIGGQTGYGAVYEFSASGQVTVLYSFQGAKDGRGPVSGLVRDSAGNLYGTTFSGGGNQSKSGVLYQLSATGQETVLYAFGVGAGGRQPSSGLIRDAVGNLYGTNFSGGANNWGVLYTLDSGGGETVLHAFNLVSTDGSNPSGAVALDSSGNIYGATGSGGKSRGCATGCGVLYKVDSKGREAVLHSFGLGSDGQRPAGIVIDGSGNLYGTAWAGGTSQYGVVYKVDPSGHETVLYNFMGTADGGYPMAPVTLDSAGNLYGTTVGGGAAGSASVIFKLDTAGNETVLYTFSGGDDGNEPESALVFDAAGNLYGTTRNGGLANDGVVYKVDPTGNETVLYSFTGGPDGAEPYAGVILDSAGNLYGTTSSGAGGNCQNGCGTVYKLDTSGHLTVLYSFTGRDDGGSPTSGLLMDAAGNLYGTTPVGGKHGGGLAFKLTN